MPPVIPTILGNSITAKHSRYISKCTLETDSQSADCGFAGKYRVCPILYIEVIYKIALVILKL
jgi:hypothetical protein